MKNKLRAIDDGSVYDITGNLRRLTRELENGKITGIQNLVVIFETASNVSVRHFGPGDRKAAHWLVSTAKNRLEPR